MSLVLHIVWKDARRLRWPLAAWLTLVALNLAIGFSLVLGGGLGDWPVARLQDITGGLAVLELGLTFVLTALLVQEDGLVGSTAFWLTRPIARGRLLAAKLAGWFLLLWLPGLVLTLPWWLTCGFDAGHLARAAGESLAVHALVALPAALVASLTDTLSRFGVWAFVLVAALVMLPGLVLFGMGQSIAGRNALAFGTLMWGPLVLVTAGVMVRQYFVRDAKSSLVWLGLGVVLAPVVSIVVVVAALPPLVSRLGGGARAWSDWHAERVAGLKVSYLGYRVTEPRRPPGSEVFLHAAFAVEGLSRELTLDGGTGCWARQTWRWPGGPEIVRTSDWLTSWTGQDALRAALGMAPTAPTDPETSAYYAKQRAERLAKAPVLEAPLVGNGRVRPHTAVGFEVQAGVFPASVERMRRTPPTFEATLHLRVMRPEKWIEVPLGRSEWHAHAGYGFRLGAVRTYRVPWSRLHHDERDSVVVPLVSTNAAFVWDQWLAMSHFSQRSTQLAVFHRAAGDLWWDAPGRGLPVTIASVEVRSGTLPIYLPYVRRGEKWVPRDPHWLASVSVALVGYREEARLTREVKVDRFVAEAAPAAP
jgi:hypothetical protein